MLVRGNGSIGIWNVIIQSHAESTTWKHEQNYCEDTRAGGREPEQSIPALEPII